MESISKFYKNSPPSKSKLSLFVVTWLTLLKLFFRVYEFWRFLCVHNHMQMFKCIPFWNDFWMVWSINSFATFSSCSVMIFYLAGVRVNSHSLTLPLRHKVTQVGTLCHMSFVRYKEWEFKIKEWASSLPSSSSNFDLT